MIYHGSPSQQLQSLAQTIIGKLKENLRCLYLNSPPMVTGMRSYLSAQGLDLNKEIARGALILTSAQDHLVNGRFDTDGMLNMLHTTVQQALADGYTALWATGDMTWEFGSEKNLDKLLDYERRLEDFMQKNLSLCGVCQYHRDTLPEHAIEIGVRNHKSIYINDTLSRMNLDYLPATG
jgi:hypothetical protein